VEFIVDTGAALEGVINEKLLPPDVKPDPKTARLIKVGDGRSVWTEGDVKVQTDFGPVKMDIEFTVLKTTAFDALLGIKFLRRQEVVAISLKPPRLIFKQDEVKLFKGGAEVKLHALSWHEEAYRLLKPCRDHCLKTLTVKTNVDLFANKFNHTEDLWCSPRWSAWAFDWSVLCRESGPLWCNPPFSRMYQVLTKIALEPCQVVMVSPLWQSEWQWLLDRLTVCRCSVPDQDGKMFVSDGGAELPKPGWKCVASLLDSTVCKVLLDELDPCNVSWVQSKSKGFGLQKLKQCCGSLEDVQISEVHVPTNSKVGREKPVYKPVDRERLIVRCSKKPMISTRVDAEASVVGPQVRKEPCVGPSEDDDSLRSWLDSLERDNNDPMDVHVLPLIHVGASSKTMVLDPAVCLFQSTGEDIAVSKSQDDKLKCVLRKHKCAFSPMKFSENNPMVCDFSLKPEHQGCCLMARGYALNKEDSEEIQRQVDDLVKKGFCEEVPGTEHPQVLSPAFLVSKADGGKRLVVDYNKLNKLCAPCALPLPLMDNLLEQLARCPVKS
jgi:hypothetical protein